MNKVIVELSEKVVMEFMGRDFIEVDVDKSNLPYKEFHLQYPMSVYLEEEQVFNDSMKDVDAQLLNSKKVKEVKKLVSKYVKSNVDLYFQSKESEVHISLKDSLDSVIFQFNMIDGIPLPKITKNNITTNEFPFALRLLSLIGHTLEYIKKPREEVEVILATEVIPNKKGSSKKKWKGKRKNYLSKKIYKIVDIESKIDKREYNRIKEKWGVRGHYRHYKSGKTIWIEEHTRGNQEAKLEDTTIRVTKLD